MTRIKINYHNCKTKVYNETQMKIWSNRQPQKTIMRGTEKTMKQKQIKLDDSYKNPFIHV